MIMLYASYAKQNIYRTMLHEYDFELKSVTDEYSAKPTETHATGYTIIIYKKGQKTRFRNVSQALGVFAGSQVVIDALLGLRLRVLMLCRLILCLG